MYCRRCAYSLQGLSEHVCPECGRRFDPDSPRSYRARPYRIHPRVRNLLLAIFILAFPITYTGLYYYYVRPKTTITQYEVPDNTATMTMDARYEFADSNYAKSAESWFAPVHFLDRRLRPDHWLTDFVLTLPTIKLIEILTDDYYPEVKLQITHSGKYPVWFTGEDKQSPVYFYENQAGDGCHIGLLSSQRLMPGSSISVIAYVSSTPHPQRIGVEFSHTPQTRKIIVWSDQFDLTEVAE